MNVRPVHLASIIFASLHAAAFLVFLAYYWGVNEREGQAMLLWGYWLVIDFPASLLVPLGWWIIDPDSALTRYWLYAVHGLAGTLWWYVLPIAAVRVYGWVSSRVRS